MEQITSVPFYYRKMYIFYFDLFPAETIGYIGYTLYKAIVYILGKILQYISRLFDIKQTIHN